MWCVVLCFSMGWGVMRLTVPPRRRHNRGENGRGKEHPAPNGPRGALCTYTCTTAPLAPLVSSRNSHKHHSKRVRRPRESPSGARPRGACARTSCIHFTTCLCQRGNSLPVRKAASSFS